MSAEHRPTDSAAAIRDCRRLLATSGGTILTELIGGASEIADWQRYPEGEVYDPASHAQYFYHRHPTPGADDEHGHFHLFLRAGGMPRGVAPLVLPELAVANAPTPPQAAPAKRGDRDEVCHLVAIALDRRGEPVRLFTTNRWVTGETWYRAEDAIAMLDRFDIARGGGSPVINRWLGGLVKLFRSEIAALLRERDATLIAWGRRRRGSAFENPRLEITSSIAIDLEQRLAGEPVRRLSHPVPARLPRMAEGWGL